MTQTFFVNTRIMDNGYQEAHINTHTHLEGLLAGGDPGQQVVHGGQFGEAFSLRRDQQGPVAANLPQSSAGCHGQ